MKNIIIIFCVFIFISGCVAESPFEFETDRLADIPIMDLPNRWYASWEARDAGYYVFIFRHSPNDNIIYNENNMIDFIDKVENNLEAYIRTVYFKGDMVIGMGRAALFLQIFIIMANIFI